MVGVAGTVTTVAAGVLGLPAYDRDAIDQAVLAVGQVHEIVDRLVAMTVAERPALPYLHPGRADVIGAGALILDAGAAPHAGRRAWSSPRPTSSTASPGRSCRATRGGYCRRMKKLPLLAAAAVGYVLGTRAGRQRYEQIRSGARKVAGNPRVQAASSRAQEAVKDTVTAAVTTASEKAGLGSRA